MQTPYRGGASQQYYVLNVIKYASGLRCTSKYDRFRITFIPSCKLNLNAFEIQFCNVGIILKICPKSVLKSEVNAQTNRH